jgi:hypothetical protein
MPFSQQVRAQRRELTRNSGLRGRAGAKFQNQFVAARDAKVYIFYSSEYVDQGMRDRFFTHQQTVDNAGGYFNYRYTQLIDHDPEFKQKSKTPPLSVFQAEAHLLELEDDAIAATMDWVRQHHKEAWQVLVVTPDEQGLWTADGLLPGSYEIIIRGRLSRQDALWVFSVDLEPKQTRTLEDQPRFFSPMKEGSADPGSKPRHD